MEKDRKEYFKEYYKKNKAKIIAQGKSWYQEHKEEVLAKNKAKYNAKKLNNVKDD